MERSRAQNFRSKGDGLEYHGGARLSLHLHITALYEITGTEEPREQSLNIINLSCSHLY